VTFGFRTAALQEELRVFAGLAEGFLEPGECDRLIELSYKLRYMRDQKPYQWGIPESEPLRTRSSPGSYQAGDEGRFNVAARIATTWALQPEDESGRRMIVVGNVSTTIELTHNHEQRLGLWRMDIGEAGAPGCTFHVQIEGKSDKFPFPEALDVPRLPTLVPTLGSILEYVLFELFHEDWLRRVVQSRDPGKWLDLQRDLWLTHLDWQRERTERADFSPWANIRHSHPDNIFR
jgi:hypothetical protein